MEFLIKTSEAVKLYLEELRAQRKEPKGLFDPMHYILSLGGKMIRPALVQLGAELVGKSGREVLPVAVGVEIFHNFTLVHDDIMDEAGIRRGKATVHKKWDLNTGILSGDVMMVQAFEEITKAPNRVHDVIQTFIKLAREVCIGQQLDMDFEKEDHVAVGDYLEMIRLKTAVLIGGALKMGVLAAGGADLEANKAYEFGEKLGLAFQIQDDWLDLFGEGDKVGKVQGGDIIAGKKTILIHEAKRKGVEPHVLEDLLDTTKDGISRVEQAIDVFEANGVKASVREIVEAKTHEAFAALEHPGFKLDAAQQLRELGLWLMDREA
ncbi:MAG: geranylgeranyl diphosphate synthase type II [Luteibaculaceae bacterium]|jgi:geranylgeranyl diphosphate synthase type II